MACIIFLAPARQLSNSTALASITGLSGKYSIEKEIDRLAVRDWCKLFGLVQI